MDLFRGSINQKRECSVRSGDIMTLGEEMKLLLHICCGPCSCYPLKKLRADGIEPVGYFFNPNIHPYQEWDRRLKTAKEFAEQTQMELLTDEHCRYDHDCFDGAVHLHLLFPYELIGNN